MPEPIRDDLTVHKERTLLVGVLLPESKADPRDPTGELRRLAQTAGANIVDEMVAKRQKPSPRLYVGKGKAEEIAQRCQMNDVEVVIFDNDLAPAQIRELESIIECKVLDRSELILDIFATHARTAQSRLQVELAQLEYTYPRLTGMWTHLDRHGGGVGTRGPGETQIETDRRLVQKRITMLKDKLAGIDRRRLREVKRRQEQFCVCLVGYTNAGKSTMMNLLTDARTLAEDMLFATLETKTRRWNLDGQDVLLSDTVGFIRDLPHHLVASFRATLEEAIWADMLIHVADASNEHVDMQITEVNAVLDDLGCDRQRQLLVLNKIDCINDPTVSMVLRQQYPDALLVSAATGQGVDDLLDAVTHRAAGARVRITFQADVRDGRLMHYIAQHCQTETQEYLGHWLQATATLPERQLDGLLLFGNRVKIMERTL